ncbi:MAG: hypothetical protein ABSE46_03545 [Terracidiphilus sp.]
MSSPQWMSLTRPVSFLCGALVIAIGTAGAQSSTSPNFSATQANESSSLQYVADDDSTGATALSGAAAVLGSGKAGAGQDYGAKHGFLSWSHVTGEAGGGFNAPIGNDTSSGGSNSSSTSASGSYGGPFLTYGGNFTGGLGLRFSPRLSLLGEYQFIDDKLPGAFIAAVGTQGGHAHIWSLTLDPVIDLFPKSINSVYVTGGGGFYRKVTSFTDPVEGEECYYYCGIVVENQTVYDFSSNQGGINFGAGFTHRLGGTYGDGQMKLYAEARYLWIDTPPVTAYNGTGRTEAIPITLGVRW